MHVVTFQEAQQDLERLLTQVLVDAEPTIVVLENGQQVVPCATGRLYGLAGNALLIGKSRQCRTSSAIYCRSSGLHVR